MGSGGVGGVFGARLAKGGADVTFIARGAHLEAMRKDGLRIEGGADPIALPKVNATDDPASVGRVDMILFAVKLQDTESAARSLLPCIGPDTGLISFQNGVQKDDMLRPIVGDNALIGGTSYVSAAISAPGVITQTGTMQGLAFGEFDGQRSTRVEALHKACVAGGIQAEISPDINLVIWQKFVFLASVAGATTSMRAPIGAIRDNPLTRQFLLDLMKEIVAVATRARRRTRAGLCRAADRFRRHAAGRHDRIDVSRPAERQAAGIAMVEWRRGRSRRRVRRADAAQSRGARCADPACEGEDGDVINRAFRADAA